MADGHGGARDARVRATREAILAAAERLFAEHGVAAVSNRQVGEAAGQGNNTAVGYHFGTKADLVRAVVRRRTVRSEAVRERMLAEIGDSRDPRAWVACLVRPVPEELAAQPVPTWFARFSAQVMTDPALRDIMIGESLTAPAMVRALEGMNRTLPALPAPVRLARGEMVRHLIVHMCAEQERALAEGSPPPAASWDRLTADLIDAIVGLLEAPVTAARSESEGVQG